MLEADLLTEVGEDALCTESKFELGLDAVVVRLAGTVADGGRPGLGGRSGGDFWGVQPLEDLANGAAINAEIPCDAALGPTALEEDFDGVCLCHVEVIGHGVLR